MGRVAIIEGNWFYSETSSSSYESRIGHTEDYEQIKINLLLLFNSNIKKIKIILKTFTVTVWQIIKEANI